MKIKIILNGTEELVAALEQKSKSDFVAVCNRTVGLLTREATRNTPADTGKLRQSIRTGTLHSAMASARKVNPQNLLLRTLMRQLTYS